VLLGIRKMLLLHLRLNLLGASGENSFHQTTLKLYAAACGAMLRRAILCDEHTL
jgi:hypothetical protein